MHGRGKEKLVQVRAIGPLSAAAAAAEKKKKKDRDAAARKAKKKADDEAAEAARTAKNEALQAELKEKSFNLLAEVVFDIDTYTFDYRVEKPSTNPHLTVWALINALKGCFVKGHKAVDLSKSPCLGKEIQLEKQRLWQEQAAYQVTRKALRQERESVQQLEQNLNPASHSSHSSFNNSRSISRNSSCSNLLTLRHAMQPPLIAATDQSGYGSYSGYSGPPAASYRSYAPCTKGTGALKGCVVSPGLKSCASCDWNRISCSLVDKSSHKRKAGGGDSDGDNNDRNISDPFDKLDARVYKALVSLAGCYKAYDQYKALASIFRAATDRKKKKQKTKK
ncbi:hypothetical protein FALBO_39 [Fusarium albosuccineum]|uniref:Uncharacterized protein n=1 Tax=Fusarium albosuccineum TaxID=1237068 RepID=A0A8H4LQC9_9HYPO|nr:hypothetical protein FALBO_39 [Fusarium albosuccineum]